MKDIKIEEVRQALTNILLETKEPQNTIGGMNNRILDQFITDVEELIKENKEINNDLCKTDIELEIYKKALDLANKDNHSIDQCSNGCYVEKAKIEIYGDLETYEKCMENCKPSHYDKLLKENEELKRTDNEEFAGEMPYKNSPLENSDLRKKVEKLQKENKELKENMEGFSKKLIDDSDKSHNDYVEMKWKYEQLEKKLAITDKALEKACEMIKVNFELSQGGCLINGKMFDFRNSEKEIKNYLLKESEKE